MPILGAVVCAATSLIVRYLIATLLRFLGRTGPGLGRLVFGILASLAAVARND